MAAATPIEILSRDAAEWKKRALVAEARLHGYRRLREIAEKVVQADFNEQVGAKDSGIDQELVMEELSRELGCLDEIHPPREFLKQTVTQLQATLRIELSSVLDEGMISNLQLQPELLISVNANVPPAAQYVGLLFQLLQLSDLAASQLEDGEPTVTAKWFQDRAPALLVLLIATGLLNPEVPVSASDVEAIAK